MNNENAKGQDNYPAVQAKHVGAVGGQVVAYTTYQVVDFATRKPKFFAPPPKGSGGPVTGLRLVIETTPGAASSRVSVYAQTPRQLKDTADALRNLDAPYQLKETLTGLLAAWEEEA
jgi:hypothetical protein